MASEDVMKDPKRVGKAILAQLEHEVPKDVPLDRDFAEGTNYTITDHVNSLHKTLCSNPRTLEVFTSLINHLHSFARETNLTHEEWRTAINYMTRAGKESTDWKNEFVLLSDCLGFSALVDELEHPKPPGCTQSCEEGPFLTSDAPEMPSGSSVANPNIKSPGEPLYFSATIKNRKGEPVKNCKAVLWQADGDGLYDIQYPNREVANNRACIIADPEKGTFNYRGLLPTAYPIPNDGPIGEFLRATGRHPHRASHIHFMLQAPGYDELTTALYPAFSPFLGSDPVFATKKSLVTEVVEERDPAKWKEMGFQAGEVKDGGLVWVWKYDFVLPTVEEVKELKRARK